MNPKVARVKFSNQRSGSKSRGIAWELTFDEWLAWWGDDLGRRGSRPGDLQMCRNGDAGSYALGNIYKGTAQENMRTAGNLKRKRNTDKAAREHQAYLDALMWGSSKEPRDDVLSEDEFDLLRETGAIKYRDKNRLAFPVTRRR
jgi:hypothetical protein